MDMKEYNKVKDLKYDEYCDYLKATYGCAEHKDKRVTRTSEGLFCHHIREDEAALLCDPKTARHYPFEYQRAENLCYCDYLEHLFLHILISEGFLNGECGSSSSGGIKVFLVPELNDFYSGFETKLPWQRKCVARVIGDKETYIELVKRYHGQAPNDKFYVSSYNAGRGNWDLGRNRRLIEEIESHIEG